MNWTELLTALALVLVIEGMMPFLNPGSWRRFLVTVLQQPDRAVRTMGLLSMLIGVGLLYTIR